MSAVEPPTPTPPFPWTAPKISDTTINALIAALLGYLSYQATGVKPVVPVTVNQQGSNQPVIVPANVEDLKAMESRIMKKLSEFDAVKGQ